jgi:hypothetical protein
MEHIGKKKHLEQAEQALGEPVEAVTTVSDVIRPEESDGEAKPDKLLTLVVTGAQLRLFDGSRREPYADEVFTRACAEIASIQRKAGTFGERIVVTFAGEQRLQFRALRGAMKGPAVVELIAAKASVPIEPL